jgi:hypothetical protein
MMDQTSEAVSLVKMALSYVVAYVSADDDEIDLEDLHSAIGMLSVALDIIDPQRNEVTR